LKREDLAPSIHPLGSVALSLNNSFASSLQCPKIGRVTSLPTATGGIQTGVSQPTELLAQRAARRTSLGAPALSTNCWSPLHFSPSERGALFDP
jgi:hypothetical protein